MKLIENYRPDLPGPGYPTIAGSGFILIAHNVEDVGWRGETRPPLVLNDHAAFVSKLMQLQGKRWLWIVESAERVKDELKGISSQFEVGIHSAYAYIDRDSKFIERFLKMAWDSYSKEPWAHEDGWILAGLNEMLPRQPGQTRPRELGWNDILENASKVECAFGQFGWFAAAMFRPYDGWEADVEREFKLPARR